METKRKVGGIVMIVFAIIMITWALTKRQCYKEHGWPDEIENITE